MMAHKQHETLAAAATVNVATVAIVAAVVVREHCKMQSHICSSITQTEPQLFVAAVDVLFQHIHKLGLEHVALLQ